MIMESTTLLRFTEYEPIIEHHDIRSVFQNDAAYGRFLVQQKIDSTRDVLPGLHGSTHADEMWNLVQTYISQNFERGARAFSFNPNLFPGRQRRDKTRQSNLSTSTTTMAVRSGSQLNPRRAIAPRPALEAPPDCAEYLHDGNSMSVASMPFSLEENYTQQGSQYSLPYTDMAWLTESSEAYAPLGEGVAAYNTGELATHQFESTIGGPSIFDQSQLLPSTGLGEMLPSSFDDDLSCIMCTQDPASCYLHADPMLVVEDPWAESSSTQRTL